MFKGVPTFAAIAAMFAIAAIGLGACGSDSGGGSSSSSSSSGASSSGTPASGGADSSISVPAKVKKAGVLNIGAFLAYPPYRYLDKDNKPVGIEVQLAQALAQKMGVKAEFHNVPFAALFPAVQNHRYDFGLGANVETTEREKVLDMMPYEYSALAVVVKKGNPEHVDLNNLCNSSYTFGDTLASVNITIDRAIAKSCAKQGKPVPKVTSFEDVPTRTQAMVNGHITVMTDDPVVDKYEIDSQHLPLQVLGLVPAQYATPQPSGWEFPKGDKEMETAVIQAAKSLIKDGTWQKILKDGGIVKPIIPPSFDIKPVSEGA